MTKETLFEFISEQKTAFLASVNEEGYPVIRAMLAPRKITGNDLYFSTNTSSRKVAQYLNNNKACVCLTSLEHLLSQNFIILSCFSIIFQYKQAYSECL